LGAVLYIQKLKILDFNYLLHKGHFFGKKLLALLIWKKTIFQQKAP
jgi:hypothetical protein